MNAPIITARDLALDLQTAHNAFRDHELAVRYARLGHVADCISRYCVGGPMVDAGGFNPPDGIQTAQAQRAFFEYAKAYPEVVASWKL